MSNLDNTVTDYLFYRLGLVTRDRREVINEDLSEQLKRAFIQIGSKYYVTACSWDFTPYSIEVVFKATSKTELMLFINHYKRYSSEQVDDVIWSNGYYLLTAGLDDSETVMKHYLHEG